MPSSSSSSSGGTRSLSPLPRPAAKKLGKSKVKDKEKSKAAAQTTNIRNEGVDPNWAFQPPNGMVILEGAEEVDEEFDWDALAKDDDKELWIIRIPDGFKTKNLDGLEIPQSASAPGTKLTSIEGKRTTYDIWSVNPSSSAEELEHDKDTRPPKGEELKALSCLLPRKKKRGNWYIASKPFSQHIVITHTPATPHVVEKSIPTPSVRDSVPKRLLKHRFLPYGASLDSSSKPVDSMDADVPVASPKKPQKQAVEVPKKSHSPDKAGKKRKSATGENETPVSTQKAKKVKV